MSSTEDYLDSLLNSIDKAKTDIDTNISNKQIQQQEAIVERNKISTDDDFIKASGIDGFSGNINSSRPHLRKMFSESEFLREFESELEIQTADSFIEDFEREIDDEERYFQQNGELSPAEATVAALLDGVEQEVKQAKEEVQALQDAPMNLSTDNIFVDNLDVDEKRETKSIESDEEDDGEVDIASMLEGVDLEDEEESDEDPDGLGISLDNMNINSSMEEFEPDEHDEEDLDDEPDLSLDLEAPVDSDDNLNIESLLDENGNVIEGFEDLAGLEGFEELEGEENETASEVADLEDDSSDKKKKEKKPNPLFEKIKLILFGEPEEGDDEPIFGKKKPIEGEDGEVKSKKEKKPKEPKPKKEKKEKKEKPPKPPKPPKPKKEKKPKEPDKSPKIPLKLIIMNIIMGAMMIAFVCLITVYLGMSYHMNQAEKDYDAGNYVEAFSMLDGFDIKDEDDLLFKEKVRILADMQESRRLYESFMKIEKYQFALDELIKGIGRYKDNSADAAGLGISSEYDDLYKDLVYQLDVQFHVSADDALRIYNSSNRRLYTIEIYKILKNNGIDYEKLRWAK